MVGAVCYRREALVNAFRNHFPQTDDPNGVEFITPFFSNQGWGILHFTPPGNFEIGFFFADLGGSDFYRVNNDGTVSVHINSNTATAIYDGPFFLIGTPAHLDMNYTGAVVELFPGFYFVDPFTPLARPVSIHGNGRVRNPEGTGPWYNLSIKSVATPGGPSRSELSLH